MGKELFEGVKFRTIERHKIEATRVTDELYRNLHLPENGQLSYFLGLPPLGDYEAIYAWTVDYIVSSNYPYLDINIKEVEYAFFNLIMQLNNSTN